MVAINTRTVPRNAYLKRVKFNYGKKKEVPFHDLGKLLLKVRSATTDWTQRHWPERPAGSPVPSAGTRCMYISDITERKRNGDGSGGGVYFTVGSYIYGKGEHQIAVDMLGPSPDVQSGPLFDSGGNQRSILHEFRCVALGETLIVQNEQGGGGIPALSACLSALIRKHHQGLPSISLIDVFSNDLRKILINGGGVKSMRIRVIDPSDPADNKTKSISTPLYLAHQAVPNTGRLTVSWEADDDDGLDIDTAIDAFLAAKNSDSDLDQVDLETMHGGPVRGVGKYKARREIDVTIDGHGIEHKSEIKPGLYEYLDDLRIPDDDDWRIIDDDGIFLSGRALE